jgi:hypothetical protein
MYGREVANTVDIVPLSKLTSGSCFTATEGVCVLSCVFVLFMWTIRFIKISDISNLSQARGESDANTGLPRFPAFNRKESSILGFRHSSSFVLQTNQYRSLFHNA